MCVCIHCPFYTCTRCTDSREGVALWWKSFIEPINPPKTKATMPCLASSFKNKNCYISRVHLCGSDKETDADLHFDYGRTIPTGISKCGVERGGGWGGVREKRKINSSFSAFLYRDSDVCWDKGRQAWEIFWTVSTWTTLKLLLCAQQFKTGNLFSFLFFPPLQPLNVSYGKTYSLVTSKSRLSVFSNYFYSHGKKPPKNNYQEVGGEIPIFFTIIRR